jgi:hypothetical protein
LADIGGAEGTFLCVRPVDDWGYLFSDIIAELAGGNPRDDPPSDDESLEEEEMEENELEEGLEAADVG